MKLHRLTMSNFMPYKSEVTVDFPLDDTRNVMIVFGDNMRGKTSLMNALRWGFYGRALGRLSRPIPLNEIVNKDAALEDNWRVDVGITFDAGGHFYDLRRSALRKAHISTPTRPEDFNVTVHLTRDGASVSGDQVETEISQFAPEQISRFFLFDGELLQEYETLLIEGSEQGRQIKEAIENVLGVPSLTNGRAELGALLKSATKRQASEMAHIQGLEKQGERTTALSAKLDSLEKDLEKLQEKLVTTRSERASLEEELEGVATVLARKASLDAARASLKGYSETREKKRVERHVLLAQAWLDLLDARLEVKREQLRIKQRTLTEGLKARLNLESRIANIKRLLDTKECPTCHQGLGMDKREALGASLGVLEVEASEYADVTQELQDTSGQIASLSKIKGVRARERLIEIDKDTRSAEVASQRAENEIEKITDEIAGYDTADLARKRVRSQEALKEEGRIQGDIKTVKKDIDRIKEDLTIARKAIESMAPARSQKSTIKVSLTADLEKVFGSSIEQLRDSLRSRVELLANEAFKSMTTQKAYKGLQINSNFGLSIIDSAGRPVPVRSAGAEQVVALSLIDGLNRTGRAIGPVVMDTPFGRLDLKHRDNILTYLPAVTSQFILLVHGGEIRPETDLASIKSRIGAVYSITEISERQSTIGRTTL